MQAMPDAIRRTGSSSLPSRRRGLSTSDDPYIPTPGNKNPCAGKVRKGREKTPAQRAGVEGREKSQRERYFFFFFAALAFFFLAMTQCLKFPAQLHEHICVS